MKRVLSHWWWKAQKKSEREHQMGAQSIRKNEGVLVSGDEKGSKKRLFSKKIQRVAEKNGKKVVEPQ